MRLIIRTDASSEIGAGHLMRCLALAQGWQTHGGQVTFITACKNDGLLHRLRNEGFEVITLEQAYPNSTDWERTSQVLAKHPDAWVVLDGYHFDPTYQRQVKKSGHPLLIIDDTAHLKHYHADIILNQNINAEELHYSCDPNTRLLLGMSYVLLRSEFLSWQGWQRKIPLVASYVLVTLGGSDPDNETLKVIKALKRVNTQQLEAVVVVGASNPHFSELEAVTYESLFPIRLVHNANNMAELMGWADVAISAGGSTCWELAFMGLPNVILVLAENQEGIARGLATEGVAINLGRHEVTSETDIALAISKLIVNLDQRREMSKQGRQFVNGYGATRIVNLLMESRA